MKTIELENNWIKGTYKNFTFNAKVFDEGSVFGINGGKVSKLMVWDKSKKICFNYDRGMDIDHPIGNEIAKMLEVLK